MPVLTAAMIVIGDEILSGRTQDTNSHYVARQLNSAGVDLKEIRVVGDVEAEIVAALNALRARYDFVFTTGGIGPTHDDITAEAVAAAFGVDIGYHPEAYALLEARYEKGQFNAMRKRMARMPQGAVLIRNAVSVAPGFRIVNVFVMAGVPKVMRAMMEAILPTLPRGAPVRAVTLSAKIAEGTVAPGLADIQRAHPDVAIGSYPWYDDSGSGVQLVARGRDAEKVAAVSEAIEALLKELGVKPERVN